jgi:hypothetical protein
MRKGEHNQINNAILSHSYTIKVNDSNAVFLLSSHPTRTKKNGSAQAGSGFWSFSCRSATDFNVFRHCGLINGGTDVKRLEKP